MSAADKLHQFAEMLAAASSRTRSQADSTVAAPLQTNPIATEDATADDARVKLGSAVATAITEPEREHEPATTNQPLSPLAGIELDAAIRLRWALRDIKAKRTKLTPANPDDLKTLIEMGLVEMRDDVPVLTNEGHRALD
ncbi:hypothetical protein [Bradyrhizobium sp. sBnM-33]|uniref:hypothetical protein n=1 Tax=Bradyrhizobium sp. sBnM-33 TaxID=2831780 RepID=UPI00289739F1|nr:hypothetical protein [Bradyrhizobium sp. sBnM-33]WOH48191.1 hypothetical protein RX328_29175 [Bradyrhizobium sp. sBnM-33]